LDKTGPLSVHRLPTLVRTYAEVKDPLPGNLYAELCTGPQLAPVG
jgi:hypothetical protein